MRLLGFNFSKISAERLEGGAKDIQVVPNIVISDIKQVKPDMVKTKEEFIGVKFSYILSYDPKYAKLEFSGDVLVSVDPKEAKEIIKEWKDKKVSEDFRIFLFNLIMRKSNVKALELEDELNLPLHIQMPSIRKESFQSDQKTPESKSK